MAEKKITIRELIETGKRNGKLTTKEINEAIEETGFDVEQIDKLYETLERNSVEIVDEPDPEADAFTLTEASVDMFESALSAEGVAIDDPVKVYLKEIGRVPLLTPDEEIKLALAIQEGNKAVETKKEKFAPVLEVEQNKKRSIRDRNEAMNAVLDTYSAAQREELKTLDKLISQGDRAKQRLSEANLRLVVSIAKRYVGRGMQFLDLIQEGNLA